MNNWLLFTQPFLDGETLFHLPRWPVVVVDDVLVAVGGVEGVVLLGAEAEEDVALEHVDAQRVHRRDHRVYPDVELG